MRQFAGLLSVIAVLLLGIVALGAQLPAIAQEATPGAEEMMPEGITFEPVTFATGVDLMSPADLVVVRLGLESGSGFPIEEDDPSVGVMVVESGTFTVQVEGPITITRGAGLGEAVATAEVTGDFSALAERVDDGAVVTLEVGDAAYIPGNVTGEIRNDGQERAVALAFLIVPPDDMMAEATPAP